MAQEPTTIEEAAELSAEHAGEPGTHTTHAGEEHGGGGLPQFQFQHWGGQVAYLLILFVIFYFLMKRVFGPRYVKVIEERESTIAGALASARSVQEEADLQAQTAQRELAEARSSAQRTAAEAKAKANAEAAARRAAEDAELEGKIAEAETRIRGMREAAMGNVAQIASDTTAAIVEKLTGKAADPGELAAAAPNA